MPRSLAELPFDLGSGDLLMKGFFLYTFNVPENENYVGPLSDKSFFGVSRMSPKKKLELNTLYAAAVQQFRNNYSLMDECEKYCKEQCFSFARVL